MSHYASEDVGELLAYIERIQLSQPPEHPAVRDANGGDGPENVPPSLGTHKGQEGSGFQEQCGHFM